MKPRSSSDAMQDMLEDQMKKIKCEGVGDNNGFFEMGGVAIPQQKSVMLEDEAESLCRDAERYRYMRSNAEFQGRNGPGLYWFLPRWDRGLPVGQRLDNAIDAQLQKKS